MIIWEFNEKGIQLSVGAYHPDKVMAIVTIPYKELDDIIRNYKEFQQTHKNRTELVIEKIDNPDD